MTSREKAKDTRLKNTYNSSLAEFNEKLADQSGLCAICQRDFSEFQAYQDHFHGCCPRRLKKFCGRCNRGILCYLCNKFVMGIVEKMKIPVDRLLAYLQKWEPILRAKGAYDPKPEVKTKSKSRRKKKSVRRSNARVSRQPQVEPRSDAV